MIHKIYSDEHGFVMVWSLMILALVALLGAASISSSMLEEQMSVNDVLHKQTFYFAEGGTEVGISLLKHNIACIDGFGTGRFSTQNTSSDGGIKITTGQENFWIKNNEDDEIAMSSDTDRDFYYYVTPNQTSQTNAPHTNVRLNGRTELMQGAAIQQLAGYEFLGKSISSGGAYLAYDIKSQHVGNRNSVSGVCIKYRVDNKFAESPYQKCMYN